MTEVDCEKHGRFRRRVKIDEAAGAEALARLILESSDEDDVTLTFRQPGRRDRVLVALSRGKAFLGLDDAGAVAQLISDDEVGRPQEMMIGGQTTAVDSRYLCGTPRQPQTW